MKVEIDTKDLAVHVMANHIAKQPEEVDRWIKALRIARKWLAEERGRAK